MFAIAISLYFLDFVCALFFEQWIIQSFFAFFMARWFLQHKGFENTISSYTLLTMLTLQNTVRYGNFLVALTVTATLIGGLIAIKMRFDTSKSLYAQLFLLGFYILEFFMVKKWALSLSCGGYFTCKTFLATLIMMSLLMGIRGNRPFIFFKDRAGRL